MLAVAAAGLLTGGIKAWKVGMDPLSAALIAAALIFLGAWLALEIDAALHGPAHRIRRKEHDDG